MLRARWVFGVQDFEEVKAVRVAVFVTEQGYPLEEEMDDHDYYAWHTVVDLDGTPIATGRVYLDHGRFTIGRVCVVKQYRGMHVGDLVIRLLLDRALAAGAEGVYLCAQCTAQGFYEKYGLRAVSEAYRPEGELYDHVDMYAAADEILFPRSCADCPNAEDCGAKDSAGEF